MNGRDRRRLLEASEAFRATAESAQCSGLPAWVEIRMRGIGLDPSRATMVDWHPCGPDECFVCLIDERGAILHLGVGKDERHPVEVEDATAEFFECLTRNRQRPWLLECVAWQYHVQKMASR